MIRITKAVLRKWVEILLHTHDSPVRTAAAFALGVFLGFSPFFGLHTLLAVVAAFAFRLNRVAAVAGVYVNLPWFVAPYYTLTTVGGARLLGVPLPPQFGQRLGSLFDMSFLSSGFWHGLGDLLHPLLWPYLVGSTLGALVLGAVAYWLAVPAIIAGRKHVHLPHRHHGHTETR